MVVDQAKVLGWLGTFRNWIIPGGYVVFGAISVLWRLGAALIFAAVGLSFAAALRARLSYAALLRLTMLAMTPVLLIDTVMWVVGWQFSCWTWFVYPVITLGYLFYGVKATAAVVAEAPPSFPVEMEAPAAEAPAAAPARDPLVPPETDRLFP
jgi:hypothetical protein